MRRHAVAWLGVVCLVGCEAPDLGGLGGGPAGPGRGGGPPERLEEAWAPAPESPLVQSSYFGGSGEDHGAAVGYLPDGALVVAGNFQSPDLPLTGAFDLGEPGDFFVLRVDPDGSLAWVTTYGGSAEDFAEDLAVDRTDGAIVVGGFTFSRDFPTTPGAADTTVDGHADGFVLRLDPDTGAVRLATLIGAGAPPADGGPPSGFDAVYGVEVLPGGDVALVGQTNSLLATDGTGSFGSTGFAARMRPDGSLVWVTAFPGEPCNPAEDPGRSRLLDVAVAADGTVWALGSSFDRDLPLIDPFFVDRVGREDCPAAGSLSAVDFLARLEPASGAILRSSWLWNFVGGSLAARPGGGLVVLGSDEYPDSGLPSSVVFRGGGPQKVVLLDPNGSVERAAAFSFVPRDVAVAQDGRVVLGILRLSRFDWVDDPQPLPEIEGPTVAVLGSDLSALVFGGSIGPVRPDGDVRRVAVSDDGEIAMVGSVSADIRLVDPVDAERVGAEAYFARWDPGPDGVDGAFRPIGGDPGRIDVEVTAGAGVVGVSALLAGRYSDRALWLQDAGDGTWGTDVALPLPLQPYVRFRAELAGGGDMYSGDYLWPEAEPLRPRPLELEFTNLRGNDWWVETDVVADGEVASVRLVLPDGRQSWMSPRPWGSWASLIYVPEGSAVWFYVTTVDGRDGGGEKFLWPQGTPVSTRSWTFTNVRGNQWWVEADVGSTEGFHGVEARAGDGPWVPLRRTPWTSWASNLYVPAGAEVTFRVAYDDHTYGVSAPYAWPPD